jgi:hypothetical protein
MALLINHVENMVNATLMKKLIPFWIRFVVCGHKVLFFQWYDIFQVNENPSISTREIEAGSNLTNLNKVKCWRILKKHSYKPYKIHISQTLHPGDAERRLEFCHWIVGQTAQNNDFLRNIIWTDESKFTNCGIFNRHNGHVWATENPERVRQVRPQVRFSINVWAGLCGDKVLGPFLFENNLNSQMYLNFLNAQFQDMLMEIPLARLPHLWFQHDGAPPHNGRNVCDFLDREFPAKWIGNKGVVAWPARSPDITPLDFFLWGALKNKIYGNGPVANMEELRQRILAAFRTLRRRAVLRAVEKVHNKAVKCINANGNLFEHLR